MWVKSLQTSHTRTIAHTHTHTHTTHTHAHNYTHTHPYTHTHTHTRTWLPFLGGFKNVRRSYGTQPSLSLSLSWPDTEITERACRVTLSKPFCNLSHPSVFTFLNVVKQSRILPLLPLPPSLLSPPYTEITNSSVKLF